MVKLQPNPLQYLEDQAGHFLTIVNDTAGTLYYCEQCGSLIMEYRGAIMFFHQPPKSESTLEKCSYPDLIEGGNLTKAEDQQSLRCKILDFEAERAERLRWI